VPCPSPQCNPFHFNPLFSPAPQVTEGQRALAAEYAETQRKLDVARSELLQLKNRCVDDGLLHVWACSAAAGAPGALCRRWCMCAAGCFARPLCHTPFSPARAHRAQCCVPYAWRTKGQRHSLLAVQLLCMAVSQTKQWVAVVALELRFVFCPQAPKRMWARACQSQYGPWGRQGQEFAAAGLTWPHSAMPPPLSLALLVHSWKSLVQKVMEEAWGVYGVCPQWVSYCVWYPSKCLKGRCCHCC
jgi:hypothetical protein